MDEKEALRWPVFLRENRMQLIHSLDVNFLLLRMLHSNSVITYDEFEMLESCRPTHHRSDMLIQRLEWRPNKFRTLINILENAREYRAAADILKKFETARHGPNPLQVVTVPQINTDNHLQQENASLAEVVEAVPTCGTLQLPLPTFCRKQAYYAKVGTGITSPFSYSDHSLLPKHLTENAQTVWICEASYDKLEPVKHTNYVRTPFNVDFNKKAHKYEGNIVDYFTRETASRGGNVSFIGNFNLDEILDSLKVLKYCLNNVHFIDVRVKPGLKNRFRDECPELSLQSFAVSLFGNDVEFELHKPDEIISPLLKLVFKNETVQKTFFRYPYSISKALSITINGNTMFSFDVNDGLVVFATSGSDNVLENIRRGRRSVKRLSVFGQTNHTTLWGAWNCPGLQYLNLNACPLSKIVSESSHSNFQTFLEQFANLETLILDSCSLNLDLSELKAHPKLINITICNDFVVVPGKREDFLSLCSKKGSKIVLINCKFPNLPDYLPQCSSVPHLVKYCHGDVEIAYTKFFWSYYPFWDRNQKNMPSEAKVDSKYYFNVIDAKNFSWDFLPDSSNSQFNGAVQRLDSIRYGCSGDVRRVNVNTKVHYFEEEKQILWQGKFGRVYKGIVTEDDDLNIEAAVKVIPAGSVAKKTLKGESCPERLGHTNILKYYGRTDDARSHYIAFEFCDMPLDAWLEKCQRNAMVQIEVSNRLRILRQITKGVAYLQKMKKVHRNLNPGSILIKRENNRDFAKISYLGFCKDLPTTPAAGRNSKVSHAYVAPELTCSFNMKTDVYSLGQIFYYVLSNGQSPEDKFSATWSWDYWGVLEVIKTMTDYNPETRMSAEELLKKYPIFWYLKPNNFIPFLDTFERDGANGKMDLTRIKIEAKKADLKTKSWQECMKDTYGNSYDLPKALRGYENYSSDTSAFFRAVRNCRVHAKDHVKSAPKFAKLYYREGEEVPFDPQEFFRLWFEPFPSLFYPVWKAINTATAAQ